MRPVVDALGRAVDVPVAPSRIVSLVPSITETLFAYGLDERIVAVTDYCIEPAEGVAGKPSVGGTKNPDRARLLDLRPDLVLAVEEENRREDVEALQDAGVPVYVFEPATVADGIELLATLAQLTDRVAIAEPLVREARAAYAEVLARRPRQPPRVFCAIWKEPYMTIGAGTYVHDVIETVGGRNVFAQRRRLFPLAADLGEREPVEGARQEGRDRRYPRISLEEMAQHEPDAILLPDEPYPFGPSDLADFARFGEVPAVRDGRVHLIDGKLVTWYGVRIAASLRALQALLSS